MKQLGNVAVVGVPTDVNSSFMPGAALAPGRIREALHRPFTNLCTESGIDLGLDNMLYLGRRR
jgi:arginase family enzyme